APLQDVLGLDGASRMNMPGTSENNWSWRCPHNAMTTESAAMLADLTWLYNRLPDGRAST
ncbi:MAG: 4-alpha-glucanotransferase, partial [Pirellula sp.]|nr:4-alpha-glucanotransferase [Pirellula sp.]